MSRLISHPIETPPTPCIVGIPGGPKVGLIIRIQGKVAYNAKRFQINLASGPNISEVNISNIAFHFNPRFDCNYVARNTLVDNVWGIEESSDPATLPFCRNQAFEVMILMEEQEYKVAVDGSHFLKYTHRLPYLQATTLQVLGDMDIYKIEFLDSCAVAPSLYSGIGFENAIMTPSQVPEIINPSVPFRHAIIGSLKPGRCIYITGRPKPYCSRFSINLERDAGPGSEICFHFNPRFGGVGDEPSSVIIRNTLENGQWGAEERHTPFFPFYHGFNFDMTIMCEVLDFLVAVNGQHLTSFKHRLPYEIVNTLHIEGDLDVMLVKLQ